MTTESGKAIIVHSVNGKVLDLRLIENTQEEIDKAHRRAKTRIKKVFPMDWPMGEDCMLQVDVYDGEVPDRWGFLRLSYGWAVWS